MGRVRALLILAPANDLGPLADDIVVRRDDQPGVLVVVAIDDSGCELGSIRVHTTSHGDPFYGRYSLADSDFAYLSKLEVLPRARGRGLGTQLLSAARVAASTEGGQGVKSLVSPGNGVSLRCHVRAGFERPSLELKGIRLGPRVLWLRRRKLTSAGG